MSSLHQDSEQGPLLIVLDKFRTSGAEFKAWSALAPLIGIDEGGPCRDRFDFLLDLLPSLKGVKKPNLCTPSLLPLPRRRRDAFTPLPADRPLRVLVSFGAEDPAGLSIPAAKAIASVTGTTLIAPLSLPGAAANPAAVPPELPGLRLLGPQPELKEIFADYDLLVTHFGLSAFEALYARVPVLLVSPTTYHERLGKNAGFLSAGKGVSAARRLGRLLSRPGFYQTLCLASEKIARRYGLEADRTLGDYLAEAFPAPLRVSGHLLARFPERSYWRQKSRGLIVMERLTRPPIEYETDYFFGFYKQQYGKTYLEDFPNLAAAGRRRLKRLKALLKTGTAAPTLLDIGCAYGPFLAAARDEGFVPAGIEPAGDAARYVRDKLGIPCIHGFFPAALPGGSPAYEAVTLWYVIEHFEEPAKILSAIRRILKPGGVLAFSTPSFSGISGRKSLRSFLEKSPQDHWTIWSPRTCVSFLRKHGFTVKKILVTGHHPERFPLLGPLLAVKKGPLYSLFYGLSVLFRLGDTFEAYAVKRE
jgi:SAM-dependent methyltransferase